jgi:photosystem II stability/assembly factor-like uncharacterized protein
MRFGTLSSFAILVACSSPAPNEAPAPASLPTWALVTDGAPAAFLGVAGTSSRDVWIVGADKGRGPIVLRFDGTVFRRLETGHRGDLWWVAPLADGTAWLGGAEGTVLRYDGARFSRVPSPGLGKQTVFGVWASSSDDVWAVGGAAGRDGFVWHSRDGRLQPVALPADLPRRPDGEVPALLKVWGDGKGTVFVVGDRGIVLRSRNGGALELLATATTERLFTVHGEGGRIAVAGGTGSGVVFEGEASLEARAPEATPLLQGISLTSDGRGLAVGERGTVLRRTDAGWRLDDHGLASSAESLHAVYMAPDGTAFAVGGNVLSPRLDGGVILRLGPPVAPPPAEPTSPQAPVVCPQSEIDPAADRSIARRWNEQILGAIRRDLPRPGVHARNLFHLSAAIYDAWAAYEPDAKAYLVDQKQPVDGSAQSNHERARLETISVAAHRLLVRRYGGAVGGDVSTACFDALLAKIAPNDAAARALGETLATRYLDHFADDGANEASNYADTSGYVSVNAPLLVDHPGADLADVGKWQPLNLSVAATQNGIVLPAGAQSYVCPHWGDVRPFAMTRPNASAVYIDPGRAPGSDPAELRPLVVEVLQRTRELDADDGVTIDISPGRMGGNSLGADDGTGHPVNPITGAPYAPRIVRRGDFGRVLAEHWADGPKSETPPGHWDVIANAVADHPSFERRLFGEGPQLSPLEWDVKLGLALNGALHDAAIAAWQIKRRDLGARPISLVRWMASKGQSSDPGRPRYAPEGLPLVEGLIELVTEESVREGRHAHLAHHVGEIAVRAWLGEPSDRLGARSGVGWIRGVDWIPYQRRNFVTPAFPGYVSGHSTFSRAAAEVLATLTGSPWFPGGLMTFVARQDRYLTFERGPTTDVELQWATYYDAADQAGQSRRWGGIHVYPDDHDGRRMGDRIGALSVSKIKALFAPTRP